MITAKVVADSVNKQGHRVVSMVINFPRHILAEFNTHRMFSRNSASSRAVPFNDPNKTTDMVRRVMENPFIPIAWQKEHSGMQGFEYHTDESLIAYFQKQWLYARNYAVDAMKRIDSNGVSKQICNRPLEPFMWHTAIVTATEWGNFFDLRCPQYVFKSSTWEGEFSSKEDWLQWYNQTKGVGGDLPIVPTTDMGWMQINKGMAEIHMMALAEAMYEAINTSTPTSLMDGHWHIPFGDNIDEDRLIATLYKMNNETTMINREMLEQAKIEIATARCARVSYINYEGKDDYESDFRLFKQLKDSGHMSPFEHCAKAMDESNYETFLKGDMETRFTSEYSNNPDSSYLAATDDMKGWCNNFRGFIQYRHYLEAAK